MQTPDAVIFDCDGVLVDSELLGMEVELVRLAEIGLVYDRAEYMGRFMGLSMAAGHEALDVDARARLGRALPAEFRVETEQALHATFRERLTETVGCARAVAALRLPKAVASSSGAASLREKLDLIGLLTAFDPHVYSADLVARAKPYPDVFLYAADRLGAAPGRCLAIEDSVNGVHAARAAGMTVWGFAGGGHIDDHAADRLRAAGVDRLIEHWDEAAALFADF